MTQKQIKNKLEALNHVGSLMMLVDFLREEHDLYGNPEELTNNDICNRISIVCSIMKIQYMNQIVPVQKVHQGDLEESISCIKAEREKEIQSGLNQLKTMSKSKRK